MLVARWSALIAAVVLTLVTAPLTVAQSTGGGAGAGVPLSTRDVLREEMERLDRKGGKERERAALIRARLENGDFQAGDRIFIRVAGEAQLTDTFDVTAGPQLELPQVGTVPLHGVLRSELEDRLKWHLAQYVREPVVEVRPLIRLLVEGDVVRPGYYGAAPQEPLVDVINQAGGLAPHANVKDIRIERGEEVLWNSSTVHEAMSRGYSIDQLGLRAGDRLWVPSHGDSERALRMFVMILTIPLMIYSLTTLGH